MVRTDEEYPIEPMRFGACPSCSAEYPTWSSPPGQLGCICEECGYASPDYLGPGERPMNVHTETGSIYLVDNKALTVQRLTAGAGYLRRDGEILSMMTPVKVHVGAPMVMSLEPLAEDCDVTVRTTSLVVKVEL